MNLLDFLNGEIVPRDELFTITIFKRLYDSRKDKDLMTKELSWIYLMSDFFSDFYNITDETDLDLGHYERFISTKMKKTNNFTTGQVYENVIKNLKEMRQEKYKLVLDDLQHDLEMFLYFQENRKHQ